MTITTCPKCGSSNVTTAGDCANCGWTRFPQVMGAGESKEVIYNLVGELEIKLENVSFSKPPKTTVGEFMVDGRDKVAILEARIANLEALIGSLIEIGDWATIGMVISGSYSPSSGIRKLAEDRRSEWEVLVNDWKSSKQEEEQK